MLRTHTCNDLTLKNVGQEVTLSGWVSNRRDHGWIIFIDLRDRYGLTQVVFDREFDATAHSTASDFRSEYVVQITGTVRSRPDGQANINLNTGDIEIIVSNTFMQFSQDQKLHHLNWMNILKLQTKKSDINIDLSIWEEKKVLNNVLFRSKLLNFTRNWFYGNDFIEVQTPLFTVSSPEGARDFLIPSR